MTQRGAKGPEHPVLYTAPPDLLGSAQKYSDLLRIQPDQIRSNHYLYIIKIKIVIKSHINKLSIVNYSIINAIK